MVSEHLLAGVTWIDLESPSEHELEVLIRSYNIPPRILDELKDSSARSHVEKYQNFLYLIMHFPALHRGRHGHHRASQEIDILIGRDYLLTVHYEPLPWLKDFTKTLEIGRSGKKKERSTQAHGGAAFLLLAKALYEELELNLTQTANQIRLAKERVFHGEERKMVQVISSLAHTILDFRDATRLHKDILASLFKESKSFFPDEDFEHDFESVLGDANRVIGMLESLKETLVELRETNDSLLAQKTNEIMKNLTVMNFMFLPLTLIASIFAMETNLPLVGETDYDFLIVLGFMGITALVTFFVFRRHNWL